VYQSYSNIFELRGDDKITLEYTEKALSIFRKTYGNIHRWTADALITVAEDRFNLKRYHRANKNYEEAINIAKCLDNVLIVAYAEMGRAEIFLKQNNLDKAKKCINNSKRNFLSVLDKNHETFLALLRIEAEYYLKQENYNMAL